MTQSNDSTDIRALVGSLDSTELDRRQLFANLTKLGIAGAAATALWQMGVSQAGATSAGSAAAPRFSLQDEKTLIVAIPQATVQLDPAVAGGNGYGDIIPINENISEGLTRYKNGTAEIEPALAESWTASDDGLTYVFKIREGVTFHDGTPLDAKAVETNFLRQLDPENPLHPDKFPMSRLSSRGRYRGRDRRLRTDPHPQAADHAGAGQSGRLRRRHRQPDRARDLQRRLQRPRRRHRSVQARFLDQGCRAGVRRQR